MNRCNYRTWKAFNSSVIQFAGIQRSWETRPWLLDKDLAFFEMAPSYGFTVEKLFEDVMDEVMFKDDPGVGVTKTSILS